MPKPQAISTNSLQYQRKHMSQSHHQLPIANCQLLIANSVMPISSLIIFGIEINLCHLYQQLSLILLECHHHRYQSMHQD